MVDCTVKEQIEAIFFETRERSAAERTNFLDRKCVGDSSLRAAVEELLSAESKADSLLDQPLDVGETANATVIEREGTVIGPYKLLQQIGEGGFGVVYMAEQTRPVQRRVALKIIKPGMDSNEVIARFEAERQALAMMDHPNIARVLDAGTTESGRPYFAMELVKGVSITEYCDQNIADTKQRLNLFMQVCRAVQHAHQKGVIHRDIKPTNVMVTLHDGQPVPKVIDFGVAKALCSRLTEETLFTRYGQIVGTPQYMSPEQAEMSGLDIDTRSDIYSLGILLYELLTGQTPLASETLRNAGFDAMRKLICESEPHKPSIRLRTLDHASATCIASQRATEPRSLSKSIAGDLDWIVMKSLEKDRNRRYESANGLVDDIYRYLANEPVEAGPPTFAYQLSKLYRRNRAAVATLAAIAAMLLLGTGLTTYAWLDANQQRGVAVAALQDAKDNRAKAVANGIEANKQAVAAKQEVKRAQATLDVLKALLSQASPDPKLGTEVKVSDFLNSFAKRLDAENLADPNVEIEVRLTLAKSLASFSQFAEANLQFVTAEAIGRKTHPPNSKALAAFLYQLGFSLTGQQGPNAEKTLLEALAITEQQEDEELTAVRILTQLGWLARSRPDMAETRFRRAVKLSKKISPLQRVLLKDLPERGLANILNAQDRLPEAVAVAEQAIKLATELSNEEELAQLLKEMSQIYTNLRDRDAAIRFAERAIAVATELADCHELRDIWHHRLEIDFDHDHYDIQTRLAVALRGKQFIEEHWNQIHNQNAGALLGSIHGALLTAGAEVEAKQVAEQAKLLAVAQQSRFFSRTAQWLRRHGDIRRSIEYYQRSLDLEGNSASVWNLIQCGRSHEAVRDFEGQLGYLRKAKEHVNESTEAWTSLSVDLATNSVLERLGQTKDAKKGFAELAVKMTQHSERLWGAPTAAVTVLAIEKSRTPEQGIDESADSVFAKAVRQLQGKMPNWPTGRVYSHTVLGLIAERKGDMNEAMDRFIKANEARPGTFAQLHTEWVTDTMSKLLVQANRFDDLETILRQDVKRRDSQVSPIHPERAFVRLRLAKFLVDHQRDTDDAETLLDEAAKVYDYHGDMIPKAEVEKLKSLRASLTKDRS